MANQVGLDGGTASNAPSIQSIAHLPNAQVVSLDRATSGQLALLDEAVLVPGGGKHGLGQVVARQAINARDWFYRCHFHQDPVMPGSLGVEAVLQAVALFAGQMSPLPNSTTVSYPRQDTPFTWKYRGQILPTQCEMILSADITSRTSAASGEVLTADASVWVDGVRIYELTDLAIALQPNL
jgi:3-hydroxymyristoyl/3-hydroxydecanoyl-(acyl carrier protein) dehydratase